MTASRRKTGRSSAGKNTRSSTTFAPRRLDRFVLTATLAFSITAMGLLVHATIESADRTRGLAVLTYGATLVACSLFSFLYNMFEHARHRTILRRLDHAAIFLLIAGTYTPFAAGGLPGPLGFGILEWVWTLSSIGLLLKLLLRGDYDRIFIGLYLGLGWFILAAGHASIRAIAPLSLALLIMGGLVYTAGAIIYARDTGRWTAPIWHSCVLTGALLHLLAVLALSSATI